MKKITFILLSFVLSNTSHSQGFNLGDIVNTVSQLGGGGGDGQGQQQQSQQPQQYQPTGNILQDGQAAVQTAMQRVQLGNMAKQCQELANYCNQGQQDYCTAYHQNDCDTILTQHQQSGGIVGAVVDTATPVVGSLFNQKKSTSIDFCTKKCKDICTSSPSSYKCKKCKKNYCANGTKDPTKTKQAKNMEVINAVGGGAKQVFQMFGGMGQQQ